MIEVELYIIISFIKYILFNLILYNEFFHFVHSKIGIIRESQIYLTILVDFPKNCRKKPLYTIAPYFALPFCNTLCYAKSTSYLEDDSEKSR